MTYRTLSNEEKAIVAKVFPRYEGCDLAPITIAGAIDDAGSCQGFAVLNFVAHCEPIWIAPHSGVNFRRLVRQVEDHARKVTAELWAFAPNAKIARMAELAGWQDTGWRVFRKEL